MARGKRAVSASTEPVKGPWELPEGWRWERLGDVIPLSYGKALAGRERDEAGNVPVYGSSGVVGRHTAGLVDGPVIIVGRKGSAGAVHFSRVACWPIDTAYFAVPRDDIHVRFAYYLLSFQRLSLLDQSTAIPSLSRDIYSAVLVPIPPLSVQSRLASRIDQLFAEIDDGEAALAEARSGVETYRKALLKAAVTGELTADWRRDNPTSETGQDLLKRVLCERQVRWSEGQKNRHKKYETPMVADTTGLPELPASWTWATLRQLGDFGRGKSKHRPRNDPKLYGGHYPFIQTGIVAECEGDILRYEQTYSELGVAQSKLWPVGTVCITIAANIAKTGVLTFEACFPDSIVGLTCDNGIVPEYVELFIRTVRDQLDRYAPATAQKNINLETLYELVVPLPPTMEQRQIVSMGRSGDDLDAIGDPAYFSNMASDLRQSILSAAFRGELL